MIIRDVSNQEAREFLLIPEIWAHAAEPENPTDFKFRFDITKIGGFYRGELSGLVLTYPYRDGTKLHYYVLKKARRQIARDLLAVALDQFIATRPVYAEIPVTRRAVINFARHFGFESLEVEHVRGHEREVMRLCHS